MPLSERQSGPVGGAPAALPDLKLPTLDQLRPGVPRPIKAISAALGYGRQRLALVVGIATIGHTQVLDTAPRDVRAVAQALRRDGFVVMQREDVGGDGLRAALQEFHERLQPGGVGFIYLTGLGVQLDGQDLLLPRETELDPRFAPAVQLGYLRQAGVPITEAVDALIGPIDSPRLLVVDAAYRHPALLALPTPGLAALRLPAGTMALFSHALGSVHDVAAAAPLPQPPPGDAREVAASNFARVLVGWLLKARITGPEALRQTRHSLIEASLGQDEPWLAGDTDAKEELAEDTLVESVLPQTPEELAQDALRQAANLLTKPGAAHAAGVTTSAPAAVSGPIAGPVAGPVSNPVSNPALGAARTVASVAGSVAAVGVAGAAGVAEAGATVAQAGAIASAGTAVAGTAVSTAGSLAGGGMALLAAGRGGAGPSSAPAAPLPQLASVKPAESPAVAASPGSGRTHRPPTDGRTVASSQGGEQPVYRPRTNAYGYAEGDTYSYRVIDQWKGEVSGGYTTAIEEVLDDGRLLANGERVALDAQGRYTRLTQADGSVSSFEPCQALWWSHPSPGQRRDLEFIETTLGAGPGGSGRTEWSGSSSVGSARTISLPAGDFEVLPIESQGWYRRQLADGTRLSGRWSRTVWYSKALGHPVAIDAEDQNAAGQLIMRERAELLQAQSAQLAPPAASALQPP